MSDLDVRSDLSEDRLDDVPLTAFLGSGGTTVDVLSTPPYERHGLDGEQFPLVIP